MIQNARKNRSTKASNVDDKLIHINKKIYDEIKGVYIQERTYLFWLKLRLVTKEKTTYLLKRSSKLSAHKKATRIFELSTEDLNKKEEELREEDEIK